MAVTHPDRTGAGTPSRTGEAERLIDAWRAAAAEARRWREDPDRAAALRAARARLHRPRAPEPRGADRILADELAAARSALARASDGPERSAAYAAVKRWEPGLFGYSETQRSLAGKIAAAEAAEFRRDQQERGEAQTLLHTFREAQERGRAAVRAVRSDSCARLLAEAAGLPPCAAGSTGFREECGDAPSG